MIAILVFISKINSLLKHIDRSQLEGTRIQINSTLLANVLENIRKMEYHWKWRLKRSIEMSKTKQGATTNSEKTEEAESSTTFEFPKFVRLAKQTIALEKLVSF